MHKKFSKMNWFYGSKKPIDHRKINLDLHRLGIFSKEVTAQIQVERHTFAVMMIGTNVIFFLLK
ncbi:hypothetical protein BD770DRAFT_167349 [Pilaira anomala]|nr:hypothetical protein BD770DRAFT_167349 [Pilaira anomala]